METETKEKIAITVPSDLSFLSTYWYVYGNIAVYGYTVKAGY